MRVQRFFSAQDLEELQEQVARYLLEVVPGLPRAHLAREDDGTSIRSLSYLHLHSAWFDRLCASGRFSGLVADFFEDQPVFLQIQYFAKSPAIAGPAPWHQDNAYRFFEPPESMIFWVPLDHATRENGCLAYARGSHLAGVLPHVFSGVDGFSQTLAEPPDRRYPEVVVEADPGDCLIHLGNTAHRSGANRSTSPRRALQIVFRSRRATADPDQVAVYEKRVARMKADRASLRVP